MSTSIRALLEGDPEVARAVVEVDRELIRAALQRTPLERVRIATKHLRTLRSSSVSHPREADIEELIDALVAARVEFVVVGGAAAVIHGAPVTTEDLDIVHRRSEENVDRLMTLLEELDAYHRYDLARRRLKPTRSMLLGKGQINLSTTLGPLDPLCELTQGVGYDELLDDSEVVSDGAVEIRVLRLEKLIEVKAAAGRDKDRLALPVLIATLQEKNARSQD